MITETHPSLGQMGAAALRSMRDHAREEIVKISMALGSIGNAPGFAAAARANREAYQDFVAAIEAEMQRRNLPLELS